MFHLPARLAAVLMAAFACLSYPALAQDIQGPPDDLPPMTEIRPGVWSTNPALVNLPVPYTPQQRHAIRVRTWVARGLDAVDAAQTCFVVSRGGVEANPLLRAVIGKRPSCGKVIAAKVAGAALREFLTGRSVRKGEPYQSVRVNQWIGLAGMGLTVTWNFTQIAR